MRTMRTVAALYVEPDGVYASADSVELWDEARDARSYAGPHPVVAHPPCQRWGRFWHGSPRKPHQFQLGDDGGCFASAPADGMMLILLAALRAMSSKVFTDTSHGSRHGYMRTESACRNSSGELGSNDSMPGLSKNTVMNTRGGRASFPA